MANNSVELLPWDWTVTSLDLTVHQCPSVSSVLGTFAVVNAMVSVLAPIFGHRVVVNRITCGKMAREGSESWFYMWMPTVGLQLGANALVARIIKHTTGYHTDVAIWELMLFYSSRPRLAWITLCLFAPWRRRKTNEFPWEQAFLSLFIAEFILQAISMYIMGRTAHFAANQGYYLIQTDLYKSLPSGAQMMYGSALYIIICGSLSFLTTVWFIIGTIEKHKESPKEKQSTSIIFAVGLFCLLTNWLGSWLFWAGFLHLAGNQ